MKWKTLVADYFSFTRKERIGLLCLISLIMLIFLLPGIMANTRTSNAQPADTAWISALRQIEIREPGKKEYSSNSFAGDNDHTYQYDRPINNSGNARLFYFDPNTLDEAGWKNLGLKDKTIRTIQNYISKGGHFYKPEDLNRIYGLSSFDYSRLEPYVKIDGHENKPIVYKQDENKISRHSHRAININSADTSAFISLPGIGSKLATRIVNFRDKLGGFYSIDQIGEVYGLADSTFQKIKQYFELDNTPVRKIDINTATLEELKSHPYIRHTIANALVAFRNEHGLFKQPEDIKKLMIITGEIYGKLLPYLAINK